jgi:type III pantothenate kinase
MREKNIDKMPKGIIISSVVKGRSEALTKALKGLFPVQPVTVDHTQKTGIRLDIPKPDELGTDRLANIVAAHALCKCPVAVIDFGTATTISVAGNAANFMGGSILPGIRMMNKALAKGTSRLSEVTIGASVPALGIDTASGIRSGLLIGTAGAVEKIVRQIEAETGLRLKTVLTGGYGGLVSRFMKRRHRLIPYLTLQGLRIMYIRDLRCMN